MRRREFLAAGAAALAGGTLGSASALAAAADAGSPDRPDILLIMADDATFSDLPLYGGENAATPHIDGLARQGLTFNHAYLAMAMCQPCRTELHTGLYPMRNGCCWNHSAARPEVRSTVHYLRDLGYRVGLAGKVHLTPQRCFPFEMVEGVERGCVTRGQARRSIGWQVILVIACALGVGQAIEKTGAADVLASYVVGWFEVFGPVGVLAGIYLFTTILCEVVTSTAVVAMVIPLAFAAAEQASAEPRAFAFAAAIAACASFVLPVGYQTNLIVYGPGGYRTWDFIRVGLPLKILVGVAAVALIPHIWPL